MILEGASPSQQKAFDDAMAGENLFLTGEAGSGKSWLINHIINAKERQGKRVLPEAPTGIASLNLQGGTTMHRTHSIPLELVECLTNDVYVPEVLKKVDTIIIDEVSMARLDVFEYAMKTIEETRRNIQVIVVGDFCQLPPVTKSEDVELYEILTGMKLGKGYAFQSQYWSKMNFKVHYLQEAQRQNDEDFLHALNKARYGDLTCLDYFNKRAYIEPDDDKNYIYLTGQNRKADAKNKEELDKLSSKLYKIDTYKQGKVNKGDMRVADTLYLKEGARVMILENEPNGYYSNGSMGVVTEIKIKNDPFSEGPHGVISVYLDDGYTVDLTPTCWEINKYAVKDNKLVKEVIGSYINFPLRLSWAITIHKSQGQTFENVILDPYCWEEGQLYVALSRITKIDGLILTQPIAPKNLKADARVQDFYKDFRWKETIPKNDEGYALDVDLGWEDCIIVTTPTEEVIVPLTGKYTEEELQGILPDEDDKLTTKLVAQQLAEDRTTPQTVDTLKEICQAQTKRAIMLATIRAQSGIT